MCLHVLFVYDDHFERTRLDGEGGREGGAHKKPTSRMWRYKRSITHAKKGGILLSKVERSAKACAGVSILNVWRQNEQRTEGTSLIAVRPRPVESVVQVSEHKSERTNPCRNRGWLLPSGTEVLEGRQEAWCRQDVCRARHLQLESRASHTISQSHEFSV